MCGSGCLDEPCGDNCSCAGVDGRVNEPTAFDEAANADVRPWVAKLAKLIQIHGTPETGPRGELYLDSLIKMAQRGN